MANRDISRPGRRRHRIAAAIAIPPLTAFLFLAAPAAPAGASNAAAKPQTPPTCQPGILGQQCPPSPALSPCDNYPDCLASAPSPKIIVISPVPLDPPSPVVTPSYLQGIPSPSVAAGINDGGTPIPLVGGFNTLPTPAALAVASDNGGGGGFLGPPLLLGILLLVAAAGYALFAVAPRGDRFPERTVHRAAAVLSTPPSPDSPGLNVIEQGPDPPPARRARRPRAGA